MEDKLKIRNFRNIFVLIACIIVSIISFMKQYTLLRFTYTLLFVLVIFFIIGTVLQHIINSILIEAQKEVEQKEIGSREVEQVDGAKDADEE